MKTICELCCHKHTGIANALIQVGENFNYYEQ
jgi:hypothetical protein